MRSSARPARRDRRARSERVRHRSALDATRHGTRARRRHRRPYRARGRSRRRARSVLEVAGSLRPMWDRRVVERACGSEEPGCGAHAPCPQAHSSVADPFRCTVKAGRRREDGPARVRARLHANIPASRDTRYERPQGTSRRWVRDRPTVGATSRTRGRVDATGRGVISPLTGLLFTSGDAYVSVRSSGKRVTAVPLPACWFRDRDRPCVSSDCHCRGSAPRTTVVARRACAAQRWPNRRGFGFGKSVLPMSSIQEG